jgi:hypothetical protein
MSMRRESARNDYCDRLIKELCNDPVLLASIEKIALKRLSRYPRVDLPLKEKIVDETVRDILNKLDIVEMVRQERMNRLSRPAYSDSEPLPGVPPRRYSPKKQQSRSLTQLNTDPEKQSSKQPGFSLDLGKTQTLTMDFQAAVEFEKRRNDHDEYFDPESNHQSGTLEQREYSSGDSDRFRPTESEMEEYDEGGYDRDHGDEVIDSTVGQQDDTNNFDIDISLQNSSNGIIDTSLKSLSAGDEDEEHDYSDDWDATHPDHSIEQNSASDGRKGDSRAGSKRVSFSESIVSDVFLSRYKYEPSEVAELFFTAEEGCKFQVDFDRELDRAAAASKSWLTWIMERTDEDAARDEAEDFNSLRELDWEVEEDDRVPSDDYF